MSLLYLNIHIQFALPAEKLQNFLQIISYYSGINHTTIKTLVTIIKNGKQINQCRT